MDLVIISLDWFLVMRAFDYQEHFSSLFEQMSYKFMVILQNYSNPSSWLTKTSFDNLFIRETLNVSLFIK